MTIPVDEEEIVVEGGEQKTGEREFPDEFYDPLHPENLMRDPVVNPAGDSYENSTITDHSVTYYPNRALKSIIQRETELASGSMRGNLRRIDESVRNAWGNLLEKSVFAVEHKPLPESYYCVITGELMSDPVISKEGFTYEREAIENWLRVNGESPMTRKPLIVNDLRDNNALYELIQREKGRSLESMHPSIRRWKESGAPSRRPMRPIAEEEQEEVEPSAPPAAMDAAAAAAPAPTPVPATTSPYPTTYAELQRRNRERARCVFSGVAIFFTVVLIMFVPSVAAFALIALIVFAFIACCSRMNANNS
jgi:hypothetical protein